MAKSLVDYIFRWLEHEFLSENWLTKQEHRHSNPWDGKERRCGVASKKADEPIQVDANASIEPGKTETVKPVHAAETPKPVDDSGESNLIGAASSGRNGSSASGNGSSGNGSSGNGSVGNNGSSPYANRTVSFAVVDSMVAVAESSNAKSSVNEATMTANRLAPHFSLQSNSQTFDSADDQYGTFQSDAPLCDACGAISVRAGNCYLCYNCGKSMGCS